MRVFDGDAGGGSEGCDHGCVFARVTSGLARQVQPPVDLLVNQDRYAQERRRVRGQVKVRRIRGGVDEEGAGHRDRRRESLGHLGRRTRIVVLELERGRPPGVEDRERRVRRGGQRARLVDEVLQASRQVQRAGQVQCGLEQREVRVIVTHCSS